MNVTEGSQRLEFADIAPDINVAEWARTLSDNAVFNLAVYLKYSFGNLCHGMTDEDWMLEAQTILDVVYHHPPPACFVTRPSGFYDD